MSTTHLANTVSSLTRSKGEHPVSVGAPTRTRNVSSIAFRTTKQTLVVDCGEGSCRQATVAGIRGDAISNIFITHMHGDHCFGLPGMLSYISEARANTPLAEAHLSPLNSLLRIPLGYHIPTMQSDLAIWKLAICRLAMCKLAMCRLADSHQAINSLQKKGDTRLTSV
jgi:hypothetical protein